MKLKLRHIAVAISFLLAAPVVEAATLAVVKDLSILPPGKSFVILHQDGSRNKLEYPETRLIRGDVIQFPNMHEDQLSQPWVNVTLIGQDKQQLHLTGKDSPWKLPDNKKGAMAFFVDKAESMYGILFSEESKQRYTQAMSRGRGGAPSRLSFPLGIYDHIQIIRCNQTTLGLFWLGGKGDFELEIAQAGVNARSKLEVSSRNVSGLNIHSAEIPVISDQYKKDIVSYRVRDSEGSEFSFSLICSCKQVAGGLNQVLLNLDGQAVAQSDTHEFTGSRRLMLWQAIQSLPEGSARKQLLAWMLVHAR